MVTVIIGRWGTTSLIILVYTVFYACFEKYLCIFCYHPGCLFLLHKICQFFFKKRQKQCRPRLTNFCTHESKRHNSRVGDISIRGENSFQDPSSHQALFLTLKVPPIICSRLQFKVLPLFQKWQIRYGISWESSAGRRISWNIIPYFCWKLEKMSQNLSSAAVVIGALRSIKIEKSHLLYFTWLL